MNHILIVFVLLWSSGHLAEDKDSPEPGNIRLMGGATRCAGGLEMKVHNDWKPVDDLLFGGDLRTADLVCRQLDCGSAVSAKIKDNRSVRHVWKINASSVRSASALRDYKSVTPQNSSTSLEITCSESVRLVNGTTLCTGRMEVKANQSWSSVCKGDFDCRDASVVCRELGCGDPLKLQFYENMTALEWTKQFQCRGSESTLLDCETYESARNTCSPTALTCLDLLFQPTISISPSIDRVYESSNFTISCSIKPQYAGGSFQLTFNTSNTANVYTQKAVNHTARFLFPAANHGHQGNYSCVYHVYVFSHNLSSESQPLSLSISACPTVFIVRLVGLLLTLALLLSAIGFHNKTTRGQEPGGQENTELDYCNLDASRAEGGPNEEAVTHGTDL